MFGLGILKVAWQVRFLGSISFIHPLLSLKTGQSANILTTAWQKKRTASLGEAGCSQGKGFTCNKALKKSD
ncbi:hypothetical protein UR09_06750 [Candidatus Nitromaritima sp. SCGC AAA799-A02]|nr:hypothetical protein UR09_06750 [Candidatus Nitromaritima sp. SCGC AAA799-A02]